jgi:hypothetical protein
MRNGLFALENSKDLLEKLEFDLKRMNANPRDSFAAFDFFVSAGHMAEWAFPGETGKNERSARRKEPLLAICSQLGNGAKHFELTEGRHTSVADTEIAEGAFQPDAFQPNAFDDGWLVVRFTEEAVEEFGTEMTATHLAEQVLEYWRKAMTEIDSRL